MNLSLGIYQGNATSVPFIESQSQDVVLSLGPFYHLKNEHDRMAALEECWRILKPGGLLAVAYIRKFFVAGLFAKQSSELVDSAVFHELFTRGTVSSPMADSFFQVGWFCSPSDIEELVSDAGFAQLDHVATDGYGRYIRDSMNAFSEEKYQVWKDVHLAVCRERTLLGSSNHGLIVARKPFE